MHLLTKYQRKKLERGMFSTTPRYMSFRLTGGEQSDS